MKVSLTFGAGKQEGDDGWWQRAKDRLSFWYQVLLVKIKDPEIDKTGDRAERNIVEMRVTE
jgi:hypothetical protein